MDNIEEPPFPPNNGFILRALSLASSCGYPIGPGGSLPTTHRSGSRSPVPIGSQSAPASPTQVINTKVHARHISAPIVSQSLLEEANISADHDAEFEASSGSATAAPTSSPSKRPPPLSMRGLHGKPMPSVYDSLLIDGC